MTNYKITEEDRKLLTEILGECWHEIDTTYPLDPKNTMYCYTCEEYVERVVTNKTKLHINHTFTTDQDRTDLFRKLVELGKWEDFYNYTTDAFLNDDGCGLDKFTQWLFIDNPERACKLIVMFWESEVWKK
jgi:hypothetical protein